MIALSPKRLKHKALCSKHFEPQEFMSRKLSKSAIPISFLNENQPSSSASTTYSRMCSAETSEEKEDEVYYLTPPIVKVFIKTQFQNRNRTRILNT